MSSAHGQAIRSALLYHALRNAHGGGVIPLPSGGYLMHGGGIRDFFGKIGRGLRNAGSWVYRHILKPLPHLIGQAASVAAPVLGAISGPVSAINPAVGTALNTAGTVANTLKGIGNLGQ